MVNVVSVLVLYLVPVHLFGGFRGSRAILTGKYISVFLFAALELFMLSDPPRRLYFNPFLFVVLGNMALAEICGIKVNYSNVQVAVRDIRVAVCTNKSCKLY